MMAALFACVELVWFWGASRRAAALARMSPQLETLLAAAHGGRYDALSSLTVRGPALTLVVGAKRLTRIRGVGLYLTDVASSPGEDRAPPVLAHQLARLPALYESNIFLTVRTVPVPEVPPAARFLVASAGVPGFFHCIARAGYLEAPRLDAAFAQALLAHTLDLLYAQLAAAAAAEPGLRAALDLPDDFEALALAAAGGGGGENAGGRGGAPAPPGPPSPFAHAASGHARPGPGPSPLTDSGAGARALRASLSRAVSHRMSAGGFGSSGRRPPGVSPTAASAASPLPPVAEPGGTPRRPSPALTARTDALLAEAAVIEHARSQGCIVYVCGDSVPVTPPGTNFFKRVLLAAPFSLLVAAGQEPAASALGIPTPDLLGLVLPYEL